MLVQGKATTGVSRIRIEVEDEGWQQWLVRKEPGSWGEGHQFEWEREKVLVAGRKEIK